MSDNHSVDDFKKHIVESEILDPEGVHHEFVSGMHGRKLDFDAIPTDSDLFREWVSVVADSVRELYSDVPLNKLVLLSVAGGTNRLVSPVAKLLGDEVVAVLTEKVSPKAVKLTEDAELQIKKLQPELVLAIEDVGTRGTTSASAIVAARAAGATRVEALNAWQRREQLEELEGINAVYHSIISDVLPTLSPEECRVSGYCAEGWQYIEHA